MNPRVSVIVPLHRDGPVFRYCLRKIVEMNTEVSFEVIVVSDQEISGLPSEVTFLHTGAGQDTSPAVKRDLGATKARGEFLAFIDDDAYPRSDWIDRAIGVLRGSGVDGVGGPGITPPGSPWRERLGGAVYESVLGSGPLRHRFRASGQPRESDDLPAYNLFVARQALDSIGGWASTYYGGEDTKVCLDLVEAGFRLQHDPSVVVYHFRRPVLLPHLRQVANVGRHRGHFVRRFPKSSRRAIYFAPAALALFALPAFAVAVGEFFRAPRRFLAATLIIWLGVASTAVRSAGLGAVVFPGVLICHHMAYGASFIRGLLGPELAT
jgi:cellulose synthase/poly-beta-1,6-N-acetylglucosamine synthase-like glycosyltransferase